MLIAILVDQDLAIKNLLRCESVCFMGKRLHSAINSCDKKGATDAPFISSLFIKCSALSVVKPTNNKVIYCNYVCNINPMFVDFKTAQQFINEWVCCEYLVPLLKRN